MKRVAGAVLLALGVWAFYNATPLPTDGESDLIDEAVEHPLSGDAVSRTPEPGVQAPADPVPGGFLPEAPEPGKSTAHEAARRVRQRASENFDAGACANDDVITLVLEAEPGTALWKWTISFLHRCIRVRPSQSELFEHLTRLRPDNEELMDLNITAAQMNSESARAVWELATAIERTASSGSLLDLASRSSVVALSMSNDESMEDLVRQAYVNAEAASLKGMDLDPGMAADSGALLVLAGAQLALGKDAEALRAAERAALHIDVSAAHAGGSYFRVGEVIYGTGQQELGLAYMEQGVQLMSASDAAHHRGRIEDLIAGRREVP